MTTLPKDKDSRLSFYTPMDIPPPDSKHLDCIPKSELIKLIAESKPIINNNDQLLFVVEAFEQNLLNKLEEK